MTIPIVYACSSSGVRAETFQLFFELEGLESVARITPTVTIMMDIWNIHVTCWTFTVVFIDLPSAGKCKFSSRIGIRIT